MGHVIEEVQTNEVKHRTQRGAMCLLPSAVRASTIPYGGRGQAIDTGETVRTGASAWIAITSVELR